MAERTDAELVAMVRERGDTSAYGELIARYQGHAYGLAYSILGDWAEAQDMAQESFIRAYVNLHTLEKPDRFAAWLRRIVFSSCMMWLRAFRPQLYRSMGKPDDIDAFERIPDSGATTPMEDTLRNEMSNVVLSAIAGLPQKYRIPLTMFHLDGLSYQKVADFLEIPIGTVRTLIHRAKKKLKPALESYAQELFPHVGEVLDEHKLTDDFAQTTMGKLYGLVEHLENGNRGACEAASRALTEMVADAAKGDLQPHIGRIRHIAQSTDGFTRTNAVTVLAKLFPWVDNREEILDTLLDLLGNGDKFASSEARDALKEISAGDGNAILQANIGRIMDIARSTDGFPGASTSAVLLTLFPDAGARGEILDTLAHILENNDSVASWGAAEALMKIALDGGNGDLQPYAGRIAAIAASAGGHTKVHAITVLGKLFPHADGPEGILDTLLLFARDPDENARRASIFALSDCIYSDTRDRILGVFEHLLADNAKTVRHAALEILTEALPHRIGKETLSRITQFLEAGEVSIRWRSAFAIGKAYPELGAEDKGTALRVLRQATGYEDAFVKIRAYEALLNVMDLEKRRFSDVDAALARESDFVRQWVLGDSDLPSGRPSTQSSSASGGNAEKVESRKPKGSQKGAIGSVIVMPTYRCTAECSHCLFGSSTRKGGLMEVADMREYLDEARKAGAKSVWLRGGESLLHFDLFTEGVRYAKRIGLVPTTASNAFWATSEESALEKLRCLKEAGLADIGMHTDPFHLEYIPLEHVRNAIRAAISLDIGGPGWGGSLEEEDGDYSMPYAREIVARLLPYELNGGGIGGVGLQGTAAELLTDRVTDMQPWETFSTCWYERSYYDGLRFVTVGPYGCVQPGNCMGISIGNARETKLSEIVTSYDPHEHPISGPLYEGGPADLARLAMKYGFEPTEYHDNCHLCYEARKVLLKHYPEHLAPAVYYERVK